MTGASIGWLHVGDLHLGAKDDWASLSRLERIVALGHGPLGPLNFVFLPGDDAENGTAEQYAALRLVMDRSALPWRTIPGDHDFEPGHLDAFHAAIPAANRPNSETIAGYRCHFLDIVSAGGGGPDFRLLPAEIERLRAALAGPGPDALPALVFMHGYPGDLTTQADEVGALLAEHRPAFVDTGHTHYNEILNDGAVVYGATRSTGQIEEDGGRPGYSVVCVHEGVPSWRFRLLDAPWPALQIVSPCDLRLATRMDDPRHVPAPGRVEVVARAFGPVEGTVRMRVDGADAGAMAPGERGFWRGTVTLADAGLHRIEVGAGGADDAVDVLVRERGDAAKRRAMVAPGRNCHAIGAWERAGLLGTRLGPNDNGRGW